jgi:hypothetical protein
MFRFTRAIRRSRPSRPQWILPVPHLAHRPPVNFLRCQIPAEIRDDICSQLPGGIYDPLADFASDIPDPLDSPSLVRAISCWSHLILSMPVCRTSQNPRTLNAPINFGMSGEIEYGLSSSLSNTGPI